MANIKLQINLRDEQARAVEAMRRWSVLVMHRRGGKSTLAAWLLVKDAIENANSALYYISPTIKQSRENVWNILLDATEALPVVVNKAELSITFPNGSRITLAGGDEGNYNSLRGRKMRAAVIDECADIPSEAWQYVIRPALSDTPGSWAILTGTAKGRANLLFESLDYARTQDDPEWGHCIVPASNSTALAAKELASLKRSLPANVYAAEYECDFQAAITGAYLHTELAALENAGRYTNIQYQPNAPVYVACDLGWSDTFVCLWMQKIGTETQIFDAQAFHNTKLADICKAWAKMPYDTPEIIFPHDGENTDLTSGLTRRELVEGFGYTVHIAPRPTDKHEAIAQMQHYLSNVWIDTTKGKTLMEALYNFKSVYNATKRAGSFSPEKNWALHWADALQTAVLGWPDQQNWDAPTLTRGQVRANKQRAFL